eukprot:5678925-Pleurochrysis_carterae.AAC.1
MECGVVDAGWTFGVGRRSGGCVRHLGCLKRWIAGVDGRGTRCSGCWLRTAGSESVITFSSRKWVA